MSADMMDRALDEEILTAVKEHLANEGVTNLPLDQQAKIASSIGEYVREYLIPDTVSKVLSGNSDIKDENTYVEAF